MGKGRTKADAAVRSFVIVCVLLVAVVIMQRSSRGDAKDPMDVSGFGPEARAQSFVAWPEPGRPVANVREPADPLVRVWLARRRRFAAKGTDEVDENSTEVAWPSGNDTNATDGYNSTTMAPVWEPEVTVEPPNATWSPNSTAALNATWAPPNFTWAPPPNATWAPPNATSNITMPPTPWPNATVGPNGTVAPNGTMAPTSSPAPGGNQTAYVDITCSWKGNSWAFSTPLLPPEHGVTFPATPVDIDRFNTEAAITGFVDAICEKWNWTPVTMPPAWNNTNVTNCTNGTSHNATCPPAPWNNNTNNGTDKPTMTEEEWAILCRRGVVDFLNGTSTNPLWNWNQTFVNESRWNGTSAQLNASSWAVPGSNITWEQLPWWPRFLQWNNNFGEPLKINVTTGRWDNSSSSSSLQRLIDFVCDGGPATRNPGTVAPTLPPRTTPAPPATIIPNRNAILPWFSLPAVLAKTPIFTFGTFISNNTLFDTASFSRAMASELRARGLWQFTDIDASAVVQMTNCAVQRQSEFGSAPFSPAMCRGSHSCVGTRPSCLEGVTECVCPTVQWYLPLNDSFTEEAAATALLVSDASGANQGVGGTWQVDGPDFSGQTRLRGARRQQSPQFVQVQFPLRLEFAEAFFPSSPTEIAAVLTVALNATLDALHRDDFATRWAIDRSFIFFRFAYDDLRTLPTPRLPGSEWVPQLLWLLVLLVIPVTAMVYGGFRLVQYLRWRRYGSLLHVHMDAYDAEEDPDVAAAAKGAMVAVAAGMGTGDWADGDAGRKDPDEFFAVADATALDEFDLVDAAPTADVSTDELEV